MQILGAPTAANQRGFFTLECSDAPEGATVVFESRAVEVRIEPNMVRPHLVFIAALPVTVAPGVHRVRLEAGGIVSNAVGVTVDGPAAGGATTILNPGTAKSSPFTIAFVANPAVLQVGGGISADPILQSRTTFNNTVSFCLRSLFTFGEDLLHAGGIDAQMRIVAIFDPAATATDDHALVEEYRYLAGLMAPRRDKIAKFLADRSVTADVAFALHDWKDRPRASAMFTTDDDSSPYNSASYDGVTVNHYKGTRKPGTVAMWAWEGVEAARRSNRTGRLGITPLHEFSHAASAYDVGLVTDLYDDDFDGSAGLLVNKKPKDPGAPGIPRDFAHYAGNDHLSDQIPQGVIPAAGPGQDRNLWTTYRPEKWDSQPVVMDNFWFALDSRMCRHDALTRAFLDDRIQAKLGR